MVDGRIPGFPGSAHFIFITDLLGCQPDMQQPRDRILLDKPGMIIYISEKLR